jgi:hypothetical protein
MKTALLTSVCLLLVSSLPEAGSGRTVWISSPSTVELSRSSLLLCFGVSLPSGRKRFCMHYLEIDVILHAIQCFFSRIRCCGNMITQPLSSNGRLALPPLLSLLGVMSECN